MRIKNWIACVQDRGKCKEVVEKAKTFQLGSSVPGRRRRIMSIKSRDMHRANAPGVLKLYVPFQTCSYISFVLK